VGYYTYKTAMRTRRPTTDKVLCLVALSCRAVSQPVLYLARRNKISDRR